MTWHINENLSPKHQYQWNNKYHKYKVLANGFSCYETWILLIVIEYVGAFFLKLEPKWHNRMNFSGSSATNTKALEQEDLFGHIWFVTRWSTHKFFCYKFIFGQYGTNKFFMSGNYKATYGKYLSAGLKVRRWQIHNVQLLNKAIPFDLNLPEY